MVNDDEDNKVSRYYYGDVGKTTNEEHVRLLIDSNEDYEEEVEGNGRGRKDAQSYTSTSRPRMPHQKSFRRKQKQRQIPSIPSQTWSSLYFSSSRNVINPNGTRTHSTLEPQMALQPLFIRHAIIPLLLQRPPPRIKSIPAFPPYRRMARHRSYYLWFTNEFRHWWKSSRLLVRLSGLYVYVNTESVWMDISATSAKLWKNKKKKKHDKVVNHATKLFKHLGQGGDMKVFLKRVHPFTRGLRIVVAAWRWIEAAKCRRGEVGVEETMAFIGNRVSRYLSKDFIDSLGRYIIFPIFTLLLDYNIYQKWPFPTLHSAGTSRHSVLEARASLMTSSTSSFTMLANLSL